MPHAVIDVSTKTLLVAALVVMLGALTVFGGVLFGFADSQPEVLEGNFVDDGGSGLFAVSETQSCSTDGDCPSTTCDGDNYLVDTDGEVSCVDHDGDGTTECAGYDKTYADAEYCGGRYDYNCDSTGCDGYKPRAKTTAVPTRAAIRTTSAATMTTTAAAAAGRIRRLVRTSVKA